MKKNNAKRSKHNANRLKARRHRIAKSAEAPVPSYRGSPGRRWPIAPNFFEQEERANKLAMKFPLAIHAADRTADAFRISNNGNFSQAELAALAAMAGGVAMIKGRKKP